MTMIEDITKAIAVVGVDYGYDERTFIHGSFKQVFNHASYHYIGIHSNEIILTLPIFIEETPPDLFIDLGDGDYDFDGYDLYSVQDEPKHRAISKKQNRKNNRRGKL